MTLTENETTFLLWAFGVLMSTLATVGVIVAKSLMGMAKDINEIKTTVIRVETMHEGLEKRVELLEEKK